MPIGANHWWPLAMMLGTDAIDSTLLMTVGLAYRPATAGNGGRSRAGRARPRALEQRGLLAADVGAGTGVDDHVQVVAGAVDVLAQVSGEVGLLHRWTRRKTCRTSPGCR